MKKTPDVALISVSLTGGANLFDDTVARQWSWVSDALYSRLLGPFPYGKVKRVDIYDPVAEVLQIASIDADVVPTKQVIVANTRYGIVSGNPDSTYESFPIGATKVGFTSASVLSGNADTDRANVYRALVSRFNAYSGGNAKASEVAVIDYTSGGATGNATPVIGDVLTQTTSGATAKILKWTITSGSFGAGTAAGKAWLYDISDPVAMLLTPAKTWTYRTTSLLTQTDATGVKATGIALVDNAGYFTSNNARGGVNYVSVNGGFSTVGPIIDRGSSYSVGIGSDMLARMPRLDPTGQECVTGTLEYNFENKAIPDPAKTYTKFVVTYETQLEESLAATLVETESVAVCYVDFAASDIATLKSNIATYAAK
jgi:hypothetical protein